MKLVAVQVGGDVTLYAGVLGRVIMRPELFQKREI